MVGAPMRCEGFVAIWLRAREDIAANRFQLLFINIEIFCLNHVVLLKSRVDKGSAAETMHIHINCAYLAIIYVVL